MKTIFIVQGFEKKLEDGRLDDVTICEVYATSEKEAVKKAGKYIKKPFFRVSQIIEK